MGEEQKPPEAKLKSGAIPFEGHEIEVITLLTLSNQHMAKVAELRDLEQEITVATHALGIPPGGVPRIDTRAKVVHWAVPGPRPMPMVPQPAAQDGDGKDSS